MHLEEIKMAKIIGLDTNPNITRWDALNAMNGLHIEGMALRYIEEDMKNYSESSPLIPIEELEGHKGELVTDVFDDTAVKLDESGVIQKWTIENLYIPSSDEDKGGFERVCPPSFHYFPNLMLLLEQCENSSISLNNKYHFIIETNFWIQNVARGQNFDNLDRGIYLQSFKSSNGGCHAIDLEYSPGIHNFLEYLIKHDSIPAYKRECIMDEDYSEKTTNDYWLTHERYGLRVYFPIWFPFTKQRAELNTTLTRLGKIRQIYDDIVREQGIVPLTVTKTYCR